MDETILAVLWTVFGIYLIIKGVQLFCLKGKHAERIKELIKGEAYQVFCKKIGVSQIVIGLTFAVCECVLLFMRSAVIATVFVVIIAASLIYQAVCSKKYTGSYFAGL